MKSEFSGHVLSSSKKFLSWTKKNDDTQEIDEIIEYMNIYRTFCLFLYTQTATRREKTKENIDSGSTPGLSRKIADSRFTIEFNHVLLVKLIFFPYWLDHRDNLERNFVENENNHWTMLNHFRNRDQHQDKPKWKWSNEDFVFRCWSMTLNWKFDPTLRKLFANAAECLKWTSSETKNFQIFFSSKLRFTVGRAVNDRQRFISNVWPSGLKTIFVFWKTMKIFVFYWPISHFASNLEFVPSKRRLSMKRKQNE